MNQPPTREMFFPFHPREFEAWEQSRVERDNELRPTVLAMLKRLAPDKAAALADEADVDVLLAALDEATAAR